MKLPMVNLRQSVVVWAIVLCLNGPQLVVAFGMARYRGCAGMSILVSGSVVVGNRGGLFPPKIKEPQNALIFAHKSNELSKIFGVFANLSHSVRASGSIS